jgi:hypothetical protein
MNFDRHNAGLQFNYCLCFDPPNFSLPSTFNSYFLQLAYLSLSLFSLSEAGTAFKLTGRVGWSQIRRPTKSMGLSSNLFSLQGSANQGATKKSIMKLVEILTLAEKGSAIFSLCCSVLNKMSFQNILTFLTCYYR